MIGSLAPSANHNLIKISPTTTSGDFFEYSSQQSTVQISTSLLFYPNFSTQEIYFSMLFFVFLWFYFHLISSFDFFFYSTRPFFAIISFLSSSFSSSFPFFISSSSSCSLLLLLVLVLVLRVEESEVFNENVGESEEFIIGEANRPL